MRQPLRLQCREIGASITASVPTLPALLSRPEEREGVTEIVEMDVGERLNPIRGVRQANKHGHTAAVLEETFVGVLSAGDVTARVLETTAQACQSMIGARPERVCEGRQQRGRQGHGDRLSRGHSIQECWVRTTVVTIGHPRQEWRWRVRAACVRVSAVSAMMHPTAADHDWCACPVAERHHGQPA